jgi:hypothetical protein
MLHHDEWPGLRHDVLHALDTAAKAEHARWAILTHAARAVALHTRRNPTSPPLALAAIAVFSIASAARRTTPDPEHHYMVPTNLIGTDAPVPLSLEVSDVYGAALSSSAGSRSLEVTSSGDLRSWSLPCQRDWR